MFTRIASLCPRDTSPSPVRSDGNPSCTAEDTEAQREVTPKFAQVASGGRSQSLDPSGESTDDPRIAGTAPPSSLERRHSVPVGEGPPHALSPSGLPLRGSPTLAPAAAAGGRCAFLAERGICCAPGTMRRMFATS